MNVRIPVMLNRVCDYVPFGDDRDCLVRSGLVLGKLVYYSKYTVALAPNCEVEVLICM